MNSSLQIKTTIIDIESKTDKNLNPFYKIALSGPANYFYAFANRLSEKTLTALQETPHQLVNQLVLITYEELPNKANQGTFKKVTAIEILS